MRYVVQRDYIVSNLEKMREHCEEAEIIGVVKGNGYGLGLLEFSRVLEENGVATLAVSRLCEAETLRENGIEADILLLTPAHDDHAAERVCELQLTATVDSLQTAQRLNRAACEKESTVRAHIILDTGFGRFGTLPGEESDIIEAIKTCRSVTFEGVYTHLYNAFTSNRAPVRLQAERFERAVDIIEDEGLVTLKRHICSTAGAVRYPEYAFDAVRLGSALIGRIAVPNTVGLKPVGLLESEIISIKTLPAGHFVGYGEAYKTVDETKTAVVPVGVCDGYGLSKTEVAFNGGDKIKRLLRRVKHFMDDQCFYCAVNGKWARVIGKVGLTDLIIDVTGIDCEVGDVAAFEMNPTFVDSGVKREYV